MCSWTYLVRFRVFEMIFFGCLGSLDWGSLEKDKKV